jgi:hypothetical protein
MLTTFLRDPLMFTTFLLKTKIFNNKINLCIGKILNWEFNWSELKTATNSLSDGHITGQGGSFIIYKVSHFLYLIWFVTFFWII